MSHYSYSQLRLYEQCPYAFYLNKVEGIEQMENAFSQNGTLIHSLLGDWAKGEVPVRDLHKLYADRFPAEVTLPFPRYLGADYRHKLYLQCLEYLKAFRGVPGYEVIGVEETLSSTLAGETLVGVIDLILKDEMDGSLVIMDHKPSSKVTGDMYKQLYLYAYLLHEASSEYPSVLLFNQFKINKVAAQPFKEEKLREALAWAEGVIKRIREADISDWMETRCDKFYCQNLCGNRAVCSEAAQNAA